MTNFQSYGKILVLTILVFFFGMQTLSGSTTTLQNGGFESWSSGPDNWILHANTKMTPISSFKTEGSMSANVTAIFSFGSYFYQGLLDSYAASTSYTISVDIYDVSTDQYKFRFCVEDVAPTSNFGTNPQTNCDISTESDAFETLSVTKMTNSSGQLGYIIFYGVQDTETLFLKPTGSHTSFKPLGVADNAAAYIDNVLITPAVSEFNQAPWLLIPATVIFVALIYSQAKKRST